MLLLEFLRIYPGRFHSSGHVIFRISKDISRPSLFAFKDFYFNAFFPGSLPQGRIGNSVWSKYTQQPA